MRRSAAFSKTAGCRFDSCPTCPNKPGIQAALSVLARSRFRFTNQFDPSSAQPTNQGHSLQGPTPRFASIRALTFHHLIEYAAIENDSHKFSQLRTVRSAASPRVIAPCPFVLAGGLEAGGTYDCGSACTSTRNAANAERAPPRWSCRGERGGSQAHPGLPTKSLYTVHVVGHGSGCLFVAACSTPASRVRVSAETASRPNPRKGAFSKD